MNNRIMAALLALTLCLCLFIGVAPVEAAATETCKHFEIDRQYVGQVDPTCDKEGTKAHYECKTCTAWFANATSSQPMNQAAKDALKIPAKGHKYVRNNNTFSAEKCWEQCSVCGAKQSEANHAFVAKGDNNGKCKMECSNCGYVKELDHAIQYVSTGAKHYAKCTACNWQSVEGDHTPTYAHTAEEHVIICADCGNEERGAHIDEGKNADCKCDYCGYQLEHSYTAWQQHSSREKHISICAVCGERPKGAVWTAHKFEAWTSTGWGTHVATCADCGFVIDTNDAKPCNDADKNCVCDQCEAELAHNWNATDKGHTYVAAKAATCTEEGNIEYKICGVCGQFFNYEGEILSEDDVVVDAKGHTLTWDDGEYNTQHHQWCTVCGFETSFGDHTFEYTDNGNGTHHLHCTTCDYEGDVYCEDEEAGDGKCECVCGYKLPHDVADMKRIAYKAPTCEEEGNRKHYLCEECGSKFWIQDANKTVYTEATAPADLVLAPLGHELQGRVVSGKHIASCNRNGCTYEERLMDHTDLKGNDCKCDILLNNGKVCDALVHSHDLVEVPGVAATCLREGQEKCYKYEGCETYFADLNKKVKLENGPVVIEKAAHTYGEALPEGEGHVCKCTVCGTPEGEVEAHVDANGNNRCDACDTAIGLVFKAEVPATCTTTGTKAYYESPVTQRAYWDAEGNDWISDRNELTIPKTAHDTELKLSADGKHHVYDCKNCAYTQNEAHTGTHICTVCFNELNGHDLTEVAAVAAKCDKTGTAAHYKCSCGALVDLLGAETTADKLVVKALGHKWSDKWTEDNRQGDHYKVCSVCKKENHEDHVLEVQDPMSGNYHQYVCECGEIVTEIHKDGDNDNKCDVCKRSLSNAEVDVKQHDQVTIVTGNPDTTKSFWTVIKNYLFGETPSNAGGSTVSNSAPQAEPTVSNEPTSGDVQEDAVQNENQNPGNTNNGADQDAGDNDTDSGNNNETPDVSEDASFGNFLSELFTMFMVWLGVK